MAGINLGPTHDLAIRIQKLEKQVRDLSTRDVLRNASIGAGGITVNGGSIIVTGSGSIQLSTGTFNANVVIGNTVTTNGNFNAANGTLVSPYARANSVVTGYVAAYLDSSGVLLSTPSSRRMKRDIVTASWTREQRRQLRVVYYRLRAAYILADMRGDDPSTVETLVGVIGEEMLAAGFPEFVVLDKRGRVFTVHYELLGLIALDGVQQHDDELDQLRAEVAELRAAVKS